YRRSLPKIRAFLVELDKFEHGKPYDPETIESRYNEMIADFADANYGDRPVYVTVEMEKHLFPGYARIPEGLALRLFKPGEIPPPPPLREELFRFRPFHRKERLVSGLFSMYATMLTNHGVRFMEYGRYREAERCFLKALEIDPGHAQASEWYRRAREAGRG
ncbi:MAG: tetratricopeptide repeat protein, partial [Bacteroidota bacterium]|nr:tetratricopeptide repeat protein [Bacteroidota bacterium]